MLDLIVTTPFNLFLHKDIIVRPYFLYRNNENYKCDVMPTAKDSAYC